MERQQAIICAYVAKRGFGFLSRGTGREFQKWFFHINEFKSGIPVVGMGVTFEVLPIQEGPCPTAINVIADVLPVEGGTANGTN